MDVDAAVDAVFDEPIPLVGVGPAAQDDAAPRRNMLLSVPTRSGFNPYHGYTNRHSKKQAYVSSVHQMAPPSPNTNSSSNSSGGCEQLSKTNLYIRGLHPGTTDQDLVKLCQTYGKIVSTKAILDKTTNKCKGYGFVDFDSPASAQKAVTALKSNGVQAQMAKGPETVCPTSSR
ncbi:unnamed protein product [Gadus morhua 'NCC']